MIYTHKINLQNKNDSNVLLFNMVVPQSHVLDVGCACGDLSNMLYKQKDCQIVGIESDSEAVLLCQKKKIFHKLIQADLNYFKAEDYSELTEHFDFIICGDVLEHLQYPQKVLEELTKLLKKDGHLLISLPNITHSSIKMSLLLNDWYYTELGILDKTHLRFFTANSIAELLNNIRFKIDNVQWTKLPSEGYEKHKLKELPKEIQNFILNDKQSNVLQYVFSAHKTERNVFRHNLKKLLPPNDFKMQKSSILFHLKRFLLTKTPKLIKYIQRVRSYLS